MSAVRAFLMRRRRWIGTMAVAILALVAAAWQWGTPVFHVLSIRRHLQQIDNHGVLNAPFAVVPTSGFVETQRIDIGYCSFCLPVRHSVVSQRINRVASVICTTSGWLGLPSPALQSGVGSETHFTLLELAIASTGFRSFGELWRMTPKQRDEYHALAVAKISFAAGSGGVERLETDELIGLINMAAPTDRYGMAVLDVFSKQSNLTFALMIQASSTQDAVLLGRTILSSMRMERCEWGTAGELDATRMRAALRLPGEWNDPVDWNPTTRR